MYHHQAESSPYTSPSRHPPPSRACQPDGWVVSTILSFWRGIIVRTLSRIFWVPFLKPIELSPFGRGTYEALACRGCSLHVSLFGHTTPPPSSQLTRLGSATVGGSSSPHSTMSGVSSGDVARTGGQYGSVMTAAPLGCLPSLGETLG